MKRSLKIWFFVVQMAVMALAFTSQSFMTSMAAAVIAGVVVMVAGVAIIFKNFEFLFKQELEMTKVAYYGTMVQLFFSTMFSVFTLAPGTQIVGDIRAQATLASCWILSSIVVWFAAKKGMRKGLHYVTQMI